MRCASEGNKEHVEHLLTVHQLRIEAEEAVEALVGADHDQLQLALGQIEPRDEVEQTLHVALEVDEEVGLVIFAVGLDQGFESRVFDEKKGERFGLGILL